MISTEHIRSVLRARLRREFSFEPRRDHMAFFGVCRDCQHQAGGG